MRPLVAEASFTLIMRSWRSSVLLLFFSLSFCVALCWFAAAVVEIAMPCCSALLYSSLHHVTLPCSTLASRDALTFVAVKCRFWNKKLMINAMKKGNNSFRHDTHADADAYFELASANKLNKKKTLCDYCVVLETVVHPKYL